MPRPELRRAESPRPAPRSRVQRRADQQRVGPFPDLFLVTLIVLALLKGALARGLALSGSAAVSALWLDAAVVVVLMASAALPFKYRSHLLMLGVYSVLSILLFADAMYSGFFQTMLDPQMFRLAGQASEISDIIVSLLRPVYLLFFIDIPVLAYWAVLLRRRRAIYKRRPAAIAAGVALVLLAAQLMFVGTVPEGTDSATIATQWGITSMQLASLGTMIVPQKRQVFAGVAAASAVSTSTKEASGTAAAPSAADQAMANAVATFYSRMGKFAPAQPGTRIAPFPEGVMKGKNVIIIQFESLQRMFVDATVEGQTVTPNVNKFVHDSYFFPNTYSQTGIGNTADNEFTLATSMLPPLQQNATTAYSDRVLPALPRLLDADGYRTITLHTNDAHFWFRTDLYSAVGYQKWYDKSYFKDRDLMWRGSSDEVFFEDGLKALKKEAKGGKPVLATFITMTSHLEYNFPSGQSRRPLKLNSQLAASYAGKYAGSISYADKAFGEFIAGLKSSGLYDNSVIVLIGDHMGYKTDSPTSDDDKVINELIGRDFSYADHQNVAFAIHVPGQKPKVVQTMRASEDIMPSVADLLGVDLSKTAHFGRSAFVDGERLIPMRAYFPGGSYIDNNMVFVAGSTEGEDKAFDIQTRKEIKAPSRADSNYSWVRQFNALSDDWLMSQPARAGGVNRRNSGEGTTQQE